MVPFLGFFARGARGFLGLGGADEGGGEPAFEAVRFMAGTKREVERRVGGSGRLARRTSRDSRAKALTQCTNETDLKDDTRDEVTGCKGEQERESEEKLQGICVST